MITNAMWFKSDGEGESDTEKKNVVAMKIGPFSFTLQQVSINPLVRSGLPHPYHLDESTFIYRGIRSDFSFYFIFV